MRRLPPLTSMKAFEAAARHGSFTLAASELRVTQAAISHQVKQLEDWLDLDLFERRGRSLILTQEAKAYLPELTVALDRIAMATERITGRRKAGPLRITVLPSFATKWLMPRLGRFFDAHPEIELHVSTSTDVWDFMEDRYELAIRSGLGRWPGLRADLIAHEAMSPVCSPALIADPSRPLRTPSDLRSQVLLHDRPADSWRRWLDMAGAGDVHAAEGISFSDSNLVLQAAIEGHGVGLGRLFLASDDLAANRLVRPFAEALPNDYSYWLVYPKAYQEKPRVAAFRAWLLAEAANCSAASAGAQESAM